MQQPNPCAPPTAPVHDPQVPPGASSPHVEIACRLLWISIGLSVLASVVEYLLQPEPDERQSAAIGSALGIGMAFLIAWWNVHYLRAGRNWMRWVATILNLLGLLSLAWLYPLLREAMPHLDEPTFAATLFVPQLVSGASTVFLHTPSARAWFHAKAAEFRH